MHPEAILRTLRHVWLTLEPLGAGMALMGGIALAAWKHARATRDIDLLLGLPGGDPNSAIELLKAADVRRKHERPAVRLGQLDLIQFLYEPPETFFDVQIDLLLGDSDYFRESLRRRVSTHLPKLDIEITVLACEDLILQKLLAGRLIDRADAAALLRLNRDQLDLDYARRWARELQIWGSLGEVWEEAFPGESLT